MTLFIPLAKMFSVIIQERNQKKGYSNFIMNLY